VVCNVGVKNQIEGNMFQSLSRAFQEEVRFDERCITTAPAVANAVFDATGDTLALDAVYARADKGGVSSEMTRIKVTVTSSWRQLSDLGIKMP
jgi:hypothetical protein